MSSLAKQRRQFILAVPAASVLLLVCFVAAPAFVDASSVSLASG